MSRNVLVGVVAGAMLAGASLPAVAVSRAAPSHRRSDMTRAHGRGRHRRILVLTVRRDGKVFRGRTRGLSSPSADPTATVSYRGFSCEATVGTGPDDATPTNNRTTDSVEFYFPYTQGASSFDTVTTNCIGMLQAGTRHSSSIVSHRVACKQFDPFSRTAPTIQGYGISTTYPDGLYSESCNTPNISGSLRAAHIYWTNFFSVVTPGGTINEANLDGSNPHTIVSGQANPHELAVDSRHLYWANSSGGTIVAANLDGSNPHTIVTGQNQPVGIAVGSSNLYWINSSASEEIVEANLDGSNPRTIVTGQDNGRQVAVNSHHLYWTTGSIGAVFEANLDGSNPHRILTLQDGPPSGIALDSSHLYWTNASFGTIGEADLDGSNLHTIVTGQDVPVGIAVDSSRLYWGRFGDGTIAEANLDGSNPHTTVTGQRPLGVAVGPQ